MKANNVYVLKTNNNLLFYVENIKTMEDKFCIVGQWVSKSSQKVISPDTLNVSMETFNRAFEEYA